MLVPRDHELRSAYGCRSDLDTLSYVSLQRLSAEHHHRRQVGDRSHKSCRHRRDFGKELRYRYYSGLARCWRKGHTSVFFLDFLSGGCLPAKSHLYDTTCGQGGGKEEPEFGVRFPVVYLRGYDNDYHDPRESEGAWRTLELGEPGGTRNTLEVDPARDEQDMRDCKGSG